MFENIGWAEILVLIVAGLFILGPERLPEAAAWLGKAIRQVKDFAGGARDQLRNELGPDFEEFRKPLEEIRQPLQELRGLRNFDPKRAVVRSLWDDDGPSGTEKPNGYAPTAGAASTGQPPVTPPPPRPLAPNERPPIDPDAT